MLITVHITIACVTAERQKVAQRRLLRRGLLILLSSGDGGSEDRRRNGLAQTLEI